MNVFSWLLLSYMLRLPEGLVTVCLSLSSSHLAIGQHCTNSDRPSQWLPTGSPGEPPPQKQGLGGVRGGLALELQPPKGGGLPIESTR